MRRTFVMLLFSGVLLSFASGAEDPHRNYAESETISRFGIVATSQALASQAGTAVLERGGNAVDAAIAANAALGVIEPMMNGVGGDLFAIVYQAKTGKVFGLNSSGWASKGMTIDFLKAKGVTKISGHSVYSVTVPGTVAGWAALHDKFGKLPLKDDLTPAIFMAKQGVPVPEMDAQAWRIFGPQFQKSPGFAATFLQQGQPLLTGEVFRNPDLAHTLEQIAGDGADAFYRGQLAAGMVDFLDSLGSPMSREDLAEFTPEWVDPISTTYHGWTVRELPPNGQGIAALEMLNIMERFPLKDHGHNSLEALHTMIEAKKLAYADLKRYVGDPRFSKIPVAELLSKDFAATRAKLIGSTANCDVAPAELATTLSAAGRDTTYLTVVDHDGNIISLIQSNAGAFGVGLVAPGTGFVLQNRGTGFTLEPGRPNTLAPRARPFHTIIPALLGKGDVTIGFGIMGGLNQPQAHAQFVSNIVDFGMNIQAALDAPRFTKPTFNGCDVLLESRIPETVRAKLAEKGHKVQVEDAYSQKMGRGNAVMVDSHGVKHGASDPRADGLAIPEGPDYWKASR
ncbi:MAG TPA: gamma-glutamyltransferase [Bryobacteraceae bacterium]